MIWKCNKKHYKIKLEDCMYGQWLKRGNYLAIDIDTDTIDQIDMLIKDLNKIKKEISR